MPTKQRESVGVTMAARMAGVSVGTMSKWVAKGRVDSVRTAGGTVRIFTDTLYREPPGAPQTYAEGKARGQ